MADITLTAGMRSNLISLQQTESLLNRTQERLATGKQVNSALDNPTNFFAAAAHLQRAGDFEARKDGMTEAIQSIKAADNGITGVKTLLESAKGLIESARSATAANRAALASQFDNVLAQINQLVEDSGYKGTNFLGGTTQQLDVLFNEDGSNKLTLTGFNGNYTALGSYALAVSTTTATAIATVKNTTTATAIATVKNTTAATAIATVKNTTTPTFVATIKNTLTGTGGPTFVNTVRNTTTPTTVATVRNTTVATTVATVRNTSVATTVATVRNTTVATTRTTSGSGVLAAGSNWSGTNYLSYLNASADSIVRAVNELQSESSKLASNLSIINARLDFTKNLINNETTGADNLTLADSNEEAANLLALQTRQQLGVTALSLASQAAQSILRLF